MAEPDDNGKEKADVVRCQVVVGLAEAHSEAPHLMSQTSEIQPLSLVSRYATTSPIDTS